MRTLLDDYQVIPNDIEKHNKDKYRVSKCNTIRHAVVEHISQVAATRGKQVRSCSTPNFICPFVHKPYSKSNKSHECTHHTFPSKSPVPMQPTAPIQLALLNRYFRRSIAKPTWSDWRRLLPLRAKEPNQQQNCERCPVDQIGKRQDQNGSIGKYANQNNKSRRHPPKTPRRPFAAYAMHHQQMAKRRGQRTKDNGDARKTTASQPQAAKIEPRESSRCWEQTTTPQVPKQEAAKVCSGV